MTPLMLAAWRQDERVIHLLLTYGANPNVTESTSGKTPIFFLLSGPRGSLSPTMQNGSSNPNRVVDGVRALLDAGASTTTEDRYGRTPLDAATEAGETAAQALLLRAESRPGKQAQKF
jgi:ankyrin repeat protein